jgi:hypothetical protein
MPVLILAVAVTVAACYTGPDASHFAAILDALTAPPQWELVKSEVRGPDGDVRCNPGIGVSNCPSASKEFLVDAEPLEAYREAKATVEGGGFRISDEFTPACDGRDGADCAFVAIRGEDRVRVHVYASSEAIGIPDDGNRTAVLLRAGR